MSRRAPASAPSAVLSVFAVFGVFAVLSFLTGPFGLAEEPPPAHDVELELEGNAEVSSSSLRDALSALRADLRRTGVDEGAVDDAVYELTRHYRALGYRRAAVAGSFSRQADAEGGGRRFVLRLRIDEGPRSHVADLRFDGNQRFASTELESCFAWPRSGTLGLGRRVFTDAELLEGVDCVVARYQLEGHYFAEAAPAVSEDSEGGVSIRIDVREGPRIVLERVSFEGVEAFSEDDLHRALDLGERPAFAPRLPAAVRGKLAGFYRDRGYLFVEVEVGREIDREAGTASLACRVREGPLVRVHDVRLSGNERTWDWVLRSRMALRPGDLYSEERVRESYRSLLRSGLFSSVRVEPERVVGTGDRVHLDVTVREKARYKVSVLAGYGSYEMLRGSLVLEDTNLFGTGHRVRVAGKGSFRGEGVEAEYVNPYFFHERLAQDVRGEYERREHPSFVERRHGGESGLSCRVTDEVRASLFYRLKQSASEDVEEGVPDDLIEDVLLSSVAASAVADTRDSVIDPDRGFTARATAEYAGGPLGSELDFIRYTAFASWVQPLPLGLKLVAAARAGAIDRLAGTEAIPIQERFFNGGESTIRSFRQDEAGLKVLGDPIGGETFTSQGLELRFPLVVLEGLQGAAFFDSGTLTERLEDFGGGRYLFGAGLGVRYNTPVGPFRFDAAVNPDRGHGEDLFAFHFGIGYPF